LNVAARERAYQAVNKELIDLYWKVGEYINHRVEQEEWGKGLVECLALFLKNQEPGLRGFSARNMWRMKQFFEHYAQNETLSPLVRELTWTNNLVIISRTNTKNAIWG
jgi:predicted nuclease of restriction endonuclease-like (RecB) superfamily